MLVQNTLDYDLSTPGYIHEVSTNTIFSAPEQVIRLMAPTLASRLIIIL